jgi:hypothetical protein
VQLDQSICQHHRHDVIRARPMIAALSCHTIAPEVVGRRLAVVLSIAACLWGEPRY